jgi:cytochrome c-type biogenesis protein CcmE
VDLTPAPVAPAPPRRRAVLAYGVLAVVVVAIGVVVYQALSSASLYFYNVDEAVEQRDDLGEDRFRLQGTVLGEGLEETGEGIAFAVAFDGVRAAVRHVGDPPDLFQPGIPVVLEGRWQGSREDLVFASDRMLVKHSEEYEAENEDRIVDARDGSSGDAADTP